MPTIRANLNPDALRWARTTAGVEPEEVAGWLHVDPDRVRAWEAGEDRPTLKQARDLAGRLRRPFAILFIRTIPTEPEPIGDFRSLPADAPREYPPKLRFLIRELRARQSWAREYREATEFEPLGWVGSLRGSTNVDQAAATIRAALAIPDAAFRDVREADQALAVWVDAVERLGVFVTQAGDVEPAVARGFCLTDELAPFIYINTKDAQRARIFTLIHELAHLFLGVSGVSNMLDARRATTPNQRLEVFCNAVAAEVIAPQARVLALWRASGKGDVRGRIFNVSRELLVSEEVIARRLLDAGQIAQDLYDTLRGEYKANWEKFVAERKDKGGGSYWINHAKRIGRAFADSVLQAHRDGVITTRDAGALLKVKVGSIADLAMAAHAHYPDGPEGEE